MNLYDAIVADRIPPEAQAVAGYVNGEWPTYAQLPKLFPHARHVSITINVEGVADVLDVEKGDARPIDAPAWISRMRALGRRPIVYCSLSNRPAIIDACIASKVPVPFFWVADWTNVSHLVEGSVATQWTSGADYDISLMAPDFPQSLQKGKKMNIKVNLASIESALRKLGAYLVIVNDASKTVHMPTSVMTALTAVAGALLTVEHYLQKPPAAPKP
jgi:hypothetical protein